MIECSVLGDADLLHQALLNLCLNARDAMEGRGTITISVSRTTGSAETHKGTQEQFVQVQVSDTGPGMEPSALEQIFIPFYTTKPAGKGTGLGLPLVRSIVERHEGRIEVESVRNSGTTFTVVLPEFLGTVPEPLEQDIPLQGHGQRVLVVDDEESIRSSLAIYFEQLGYRVVAASSGNEAICRFRETESPIQIVLTDLAMSNGSGLDLLTEIRRTDSRLPVVLCTGSIDSNTAELSSGDPHTTVCSKPYHLRDLGLLVSRLLASPPN